MRPPRALRVGDRPEPRRIAAVTQTDIVRFAGAGGDFNPLHHDAAFASAAGFRSVIAMGQLPAGLLGAFVSDWVGVEQLRELSVRFVAPVYLGDALELTGEVHSVVDGTAVIGLTATVNAKPVVTGQAKAVVGT